jgi:hypothetical protein
MRDHIVPPIACSLGLFARGDLLRVGVSAGAHPRGYAARSGASHACLLDEHAIIAFYSRRKFSSIIKITETEQVVRIFDISLKVC